VRWRRISVKMGAGVPQQIGGEGLRGGVDFLSAVTHAARSPAAAAADVASTLCSSLEELAEVSSDTKEHHLQVVLQFFIMHYIFLFGFQAGIQVGVTVVSVLNMALGESRTVEIVLISIDWTLVLLLMVELLAQVYVVGVRQFLSLREHKVDLAILACSLSFCLIDTFEWFQAPEDSKLMEHLFDSIRMALRLLRMWVFIDQIYILLRQPLRLIPQAP